MTTSKCEGSIERSIRFIPYDVGSKDSKIIANLKELVDEETLSWLLAEFAENRDKAKAKAKSYDIPSIHKAASLGLLSSDEPPEASPSPQRQHDVRGTEQLKKRYTSSPDMLEPQAFGLKGNATASGR